jgi:TolB-like protein/Tfp pilus assembly protein PilF
LGQIFDELKRRNVIRVAVAYLVAAWLVLQVADLVLENIGAPPWVMQVLILLFALGFPLVMLFSWAYELTPEGLKREKDVDRSKSVTHATGRKLNQITIGLLLFVLAFVAVERLVLPNDPAGASAGGQAAITDRSIAVLAFEDLSEDGDQEYFADGLSEELLNVLAQVPDLQVAGRTSSFAFKGQNRDLREIGDLLNVAHILEGSVRKAGNRIRVTAQLINTDSGFHLLSESYDRDLDDIFEVQDELAHSISKALQSELMGTPVVAEASPTEVAAYDLYLEALQKIHTRDKNEMTEAVQLLDRALDIDPDYVPALTQKALGIYLLSDSNGAYGDIPEDEALAIARPLLDRALALDERNAEAYAVSGLIMSEEGVSLDQQIATLRRAVALNPTLDNARTWLSSALSIARQFEEAQLLLEGIVERDPMFGPAINNLTQIYVRTREFDKANALIDRVERISGETDDIRQSRGYIALNRGELASAIRLMKPVYDANPAATVNQFFYAVTLMSIGEFDPLLEMSNPFLKVIGNIRAGNQEIALAMLDDLVAKLPVEDTIDLAVFVNGYMNDLDSVASFVDQRFGNVNELLALDPKLDSFDLGYMPMLAWTYLQQGRQDDYELVVAAMQQALESNDASDSVNFPVVNAVADFSAVTGDVDLLLDTVRKLVDIDAVDVELFGLPYYQPYFDIDEFRSLNAAVVERANVERAKLGMTPYQPIAVTE